MVYLMFTQNYGYENDIIDHTQPQKAKAKYQQNRNVSLHFFTQPNHMATPMWACSIECNASIVCNGKVFEEDLTRKRDINIIMRQYIDKDLNIPSLQ